MSVNGITPLTMEEEDQVILARITNDERHLKRVVKKLHSYTSATATKTAAPRSAAPQSAAVEDAREAFLVELLSYQLLLKKSMMICEAETRQVEEYQAEQQRIEEEQGALRAQIKELKVALEHAQLLRRRKMEYDVVAEKIHALPSRDELEQEIQALDNDMAAIRSENENQDKAIQGHKSALDGIIADLASLRFLGRDKDIASDAPSTRATPMPDTISSIGVEGGAVDDSTRANSVAALQTMKEEIENEKSAAESDAVKAVGMAADNDIEMGELAEDPKEKEMGELADDTKDKEMGELAEDPQEKEAAKKKFREELEEGEASDESSELSEPPDSDEDI